MSKIAALSPDKSQSSGNNEILNIKALEPHSKAGKFAAKKSTEEPKKSIWPSVFYGLVVGALSFLMKFLPEKIGKFLSKIIPPVFKTDSPFAPE